ncbi:MAG: hypothetical protein PHQ86_06525 [Dehalococcoidales bacterium]|jgi:predicted transcriptional regulator|nr:hypothetical protein [Dehalococcoidales bacterium]
MNNKRPNRHSNPSQYAKRNRKEKFRFIRKKKRETRELLKAVLS